MNARIRPGSAVESAAMGGLRGPDPYKVRFANVDSLKRGVHGWADETLPLLPKKQLEWGLNADEIEQRNREFMRAQGRPVRFSEEDKGLAKEAQKVHEILVKALVQMDAFLAKVPERPQGHFLSKSHFEGSLRRFSDDVRHARYPLRLPFGPLHHYEWTPLQIFIAEYGNPQWRNGKLVIQGFGGDVDKYVAASIHAGIHEERLQLFFNDFQEKEARKPRPKDGPTLENALKRVRKALWDKTKELCPKPVVGEVAPND